MRVVTIDVPHLGNRTHLVHDGRVGVVIDPPRDHEAVEKAAEEAGVDIVAVAETHIHNDYVSGGLCLSRRHGAEYLVSSDEDVEFARIGVARQRDAGLRRHRPPRHRHPRPHPSPPVLPGHRRDHRRQPAGSTVQRRQPAARQRRAHRPHRPDPHHRSDARAVADRTPARARSPPRRSLHPTHGFGSFCASAPGRRADGEITIGDQRGSNPALTTTRDTFVTRPARGSGPGAEPLRPHGAAQPARRLDAATRQPARRRPGRRGPLPRSGRRRRAQHRGLRGRAHRPARWRSPPGRSARCTPAGSPRGAPSWCCVSDSSRGARAGGARAGVHRHRGCRDRRTRRHGDGTDAAAAYRLDRLRRRPSGTADAVVLDVRRPDEWCAGHLPGARNIPVHELPHRLEEIPRGRGLGALRRRLPGRRSPPGCSTAPDATSCWSTTSSRGSPRSESPCCVGDPLPEGSCGVRAFGGRAPLSQSRSAEARLHGG